MLVGSLYILKIYDRVLAPGISAEIYIQVNSRASLQYLIIS